MDGLNYFQGRVPIPPTDEKQGFLPQLSNGVLENAKQQQLLDDATREALLLELAKVVSMSRSPKHRSPNKERPIAVPPEFLLLGRDHARVMTQLEVWLQEEADEFGETFRILHPDEPQKNASPFKDLDKLRAERELEQELAKQRELEALRQKQLKEEEERARKAKEKADEERARLAKEKAEEEALRRRRASEDSRRQRELDAARAAAEAAAEAEAEAQRLRAARDRRISFGGQTDAFSADSAVQTTARRRSSVMTPRYLDMQSKLESERKAREEMEEQLRRQAAEAAAAPAMSPMEMEMLKDLQEELERERNAKEALQAQLEKGQQLVALKLLEDAKKKEESDRVKELVDAARRNEEMRAMQSQQEYERLLGNQKAQIADLERQLQTERAERQELEKAVVAGDEKARDEAQIALIESRRRSSVHEKRRGSMKTPRLLAAEEELERERKARELLEKALREREDARAADEVEAIEALLQNLRDELAKEKEARKAAEAAAQAAATAAQMAQKADDREERRRMRDLLNAARRSEQLRTLPDSDHKELFPNEQRVRIQLIEKELQAEREQRERVEQALHDREAQFLTTEPKEMMAAAAEGGDRIQLGRAYRALEEARRREAADHVNAMQISAVKRGLDPSVQEKIESLQRELEIERRRRYDAEQALVEAQNRALSTAALQGAEKLSEREQAFKMLEDARRRASVDGKRIALLDAERLKELEKQLEDEKKTRAQLEEALRLAEARAREAEEKEAAERKRREELQAGTDEIRKLESELEHERRTKAELQDALKHREQRCNELEAQVAEQTQRNQTLEKEREEDRRAAKAELEKILKGDDERARAVALMGSASTREEKDSARTLLNEARKRQDQEAGDANHEKEVSRLNEQLEKLHEELDKERAKGSELAGSAQELTHIVEELRKLKLDNAELQKMLDLERERVKAAKDEELQKLQQEFERQQAERESLKRAYQEDEAKLRASYEEQEATRRQDIEYAYELLEAARMQKPLTRRGSKTPRIRQLQEELENERRAREQITGSSQLSAEEIAKLRETLKLLEDENERVEEEMDRMRKDQEDELATLRKRLADEARRREDAERRLREAQLGKQAVDFNKEKARCEAQEAEVRRTIERQRDEGFRRMQTEGHYAREAILNANKPKDDISKRGRIQRDVEEQRRREEAIRQYELTKAKKEHDFKKKMEGAHRKHVEERERILREYSLLRDAEEARIQAEIADRLARERRQLQGPADDHYNDLVRTLRYTHEKSDSLKKQNLEEQRRWVLDHSQYQSALHDAEFQNQRSTLERTMLPRVAPKPVVLQPIVRQPAPQREPLAPPPAQLPSTTSPTAPTEAWSPYSSVPLTLGRLVHLKQSFARCDPEEKGYLTLEQLGLWVQTMGVQNVTYDHLKRMMQQVDLENTGVVEFWAFVAIQVYISLTPEQRQTIDLPGWIRFCTQRVRQRPQQSRTSPTARSPSSVMISTASPTMLMSTNGGGRSPSTYQQNMMPMTSPSGNFMVYPQNASPQQQQRPPAMQASF